MYVSAFRDVLLWSHPHHLRPVSQSLTSSLIYSELTLQMRTLVGAGNTKLNRTQFLPSSSWWSVKETERKPLRTRNGGECCYGKTQNATGTRGWEQAGVYLSTGKLMQGEKTQLRVISRWTVLSRRKNLRVWEGLEGENTVCPETSERFETQEAGKKWGKTRGEWKGMAN